MGRWEIVSYGRGSPIETDYVTIELTHKTANGKTSSWAVRCRGGLCLNKKGKWEYEPSPSNRTLPFLKRCRFSTAKKAMAAADKAKNPW